MNVEDYLEILAGINTVFPAKLESKDKRLIVSLGRQTYKGMPLTDRQYNLAVKKIIEYKKQFFENYFFDIEKNLKKLRMPLRSIDRTKKVFIVERQKSFFSVDKEKYIAIKFSFNKKMIKYIELIESLQDRKDYDSKLKIHYIKFTERNVYTIVSKLKSTNFEIQKELLELYENLKNMEDNKEKYAPGIYGLELKNLNKYAFDYAINSIGIPNLDNLAIYKDREKMLGLYHIDEDILNESLNNLQPLTKKIVGRTRKNVFVSKKQHSFEHVVESIVELFRYPVLVILPKDNEDKVFQYTFKVFNKVFLTREIAVLYRLPNNSSEGITFNQFVKTHNLNNTVDDTTKVVYISQTKLPKPLVKLDWVPNTVLLPDSYTTFRLTKHLQSYVENCDLIIHFDKHVTPWLQNKIEQL